MVAKHLLIRWLQVGGGGDAGGGGDGVVIDDPEPEDEGFGGPPTMSPTMSISIGSSNQGMDNEADTQSSMERAIDVLIVIAAGIAMVLGLLLLTWILAKFIDQYCCCCSSFRPVSFASDQEFDRGVVSRKAGLWGLLQTERTQILQHLFQPVVWSGTGEDEEANLVTDGNDEINTVTVTSKEDQTHNLASSTSNRPGDSIPADDAQHQLVCCICLNPYLDNCQVMTGKTCSHMFHYNCCMKWLKRHDECPYCRQELMTGRQFREAAVQVLGESRVRALSGAWLQGRENPAEGDNNGSNGAEEGDGGIEMGRIAVSDEEAQLSDIEA